MSKDLIVYFDKQVGRNIHLIEFFRKVFFHINDPKYSNDKKEKSLDKLEIMINIYLQNGNDKPIYSKMEDNLKCNQDIYPALYHLKIIEHSLEDFYEANAYYANKNHNEFLKQSLIEFNNALSHLSAGYYSSDTRWEQNIKKAGTHLHRGALDYYKTIILNKDSLTTPQKEKIVQIRTDEIHSVGVDINNPNKKNIISIYKEFANSL